MAVPVVPVLNLWAVHQAFGGAAGPLLMMVNILIFVAYIQVGALVVYRILHRHGQLAARALTTAHRIETARATRQAVDRDRAARYRNLERTLLPLVRGLADGAVDPQDPRNQTEAWVAAGTLRALLEHDARSVSQQTIDAVTSIASAAGRRGVAPEIRIDNLDGLPPVVSASLVDVMTRALAQAMPGEATLVLRNTQAAATATVCMPAATPSGRLQQTLVTTSRPMPLNTDVVQLDDSRVWLEARWTR